MIQRRIRRRIQKMNTGEMCEGDIATLRSLGRVTRLVWLIELLLLSFVPLAMPYVTYWAHDERESGLLGAAAPF